MYSSSINIIAVFIAAVASMILGGVWYSLLFGSVWMKINGMTPEEVARFPKSKLAFDYFLTFLCSLVTAIVLALFIQNLFVPVLSQALKIGLFAGVGFTITPLISTFLFGSKNRSYKALAINTGFYLISFVLQAFIIFLFS